MNIKFQNTVTAVVFFVSTLVTVNCLQCYVCNNCATVGYADLQTCVVSTTIRPPTSSTSPTTAVPPISPDTTATVESENTTPTITTVTAESENTPPATTTVAESEITTPATTTVAESEITTPATTTVAESEITTPATTTVAESEITTPATTTVAESENTTLATTTVAESEDTPPATATVTESENTPPATTTVEESENTSPATTTVAEPENITPAEFLLYKDVDSSNSITCGNGEPCSPRVIHVRSVNDFRAIDVTFVCVKEERDNGNGTVIINRGCAVKSNRTCEDSGFVTGCHICETDRCNSAPIVAISLVAFILAVVVNFI